MLGATCRSNAARYGRTSLGTPSTFRADPGSSPETRTFRSGRRSTRISRDGPDARRWKIGLPPAASRALPTHLLSGLQEAVHGPGLQVRRQASASVVVDHHATSAWYAAVDRTRIWTALRTEVQSLEAPW